MPDLPPAFPYYPTAYSDGTVIEKVIVCDCCGLNRQYSYENGIYTALEFKPDSLCPWCVYSGDAAAKYDGSFQEVDFSISTSQSNVSVATTRTPHVLVWNPINWPDHCGECCAYLGRFDSLSNDTLLSTESIQADLDKISSRIRMSISEILDWNQRGSIHLRLFQCLVCNAHRMALDLD